ncbi:hypothetical protein [Streptomyces sp. NPDC048644]|uniref:hypothetical protein n=1 Tax=Streptomyces sp. NPDC048644 TaxID=3365582 RepID=UPI003712131B
MMADTHVHAFHVQELTELHRLAGALWTKLLSGDNTPHLRERINSLEAAQSTLLWEAPELIAACSSAAERRRVASRRVMAAAGAW